MEFSAEYHDDHQYLAHPWPVVHRTGHYSPFGVSPEKGSFGIGSPCSEEYKSDVCRVNPGVLIQSKCQVQVLHGL